MISSSANIEAAKQLREEQFQKDKAFIASIANTSPYFKELAEEAKNQSTFEGDRVINTDAGQHVLLGLGSQLRNAVNVYALSLNPENALAAYTQTYSLLPENIKTSAVTPESLQGKPLAEIQAATHNLNTLLSSIPKLDGAHLETQMLEKSLSPRIAPKPGQGTDHDSFISSSKLQSQYWFPLKNFVSPVKNQGKRGTCWAFTAIGAIESRERVQNDNPVYLSEQFFINKVKQDWEIYANYTEDGYYSGFALTQAMFNGDSYTSPGQTLLNEKDWTYNSANSIKKLPYAPFTDACLGYKEKEGTCSESAGEGPEVCTQSSLGLPSCAFLKVTAPQEGVKASFARQVWAQGQPFELNNYQLLLSQGHVLMASFPIYRGFREAADGFLSNYAQTSIDSNGKEVAGNSGLHELQIIGFLDNDTLSSLIKSSNIGGGGYFIAKNSWGYKAGDGGYYYIPADYVSKNFINLNILDFDARRSNKWNQDQTLPDGGIAPVIAPKDSLNVVGLRIPTDLKPMFKVSHNTADSVNLTVTSSLGEKIYDGPWNTSKEVNFIKNKLDYSFNTQGLRNISLVAKYGTAVAKSNFTIRVDNTAPNLVLQNTGNPVLNEAYSIFAQVSDINETDTTKLCANTNWAVDGADVLSSTTGCQVNVKFTTTGARQVRVSTRDAEGLFTSKTLTLNVQAPAVNPFPKITSLSVNSRDRSPRGEGSIPISFCSDVGVTNGKTIDLRASGCKFFLGGKDVNRYYATVTVENPSNEALTYDWNLLVTADGAEISLYSTVVPSSSNTFDLYDYGNELLVTNPCRISVKVNALDPSRSKGPLTVWTGQCTYHAIKLR